MFGSRDGGRRRKGTGDTTGGQPGEPDAGGGAAGLPPSEDRGQGFLTPAPASSPPPTEAPGAGGGAYRSVAPPGELDEAVDTVAVVLRDLGRFAVDIGSEGAEAIAGEAERWAQHVLIFAPSPDGRGRTGDRRRNWPGVRRFLARHRRADAERVAQSLRGLRSVVWAFVRSLRNAAGDPEADAQMRSHLDRLREAALAGEPRRLERQALEAADAIAGILERRAEELRRERARLGERLHHLGFELEEVRDQATRDPLTGVMNRRSLDAFLERTVDLCAALDQPALLLMVDVDHFKRVNDTFGHPAGDEVLRVVADTLVRTFLRKNDFVGRYGGEEFVVVLRDAGNASAEQVGQRLLDAVRRLRIPVPAPTPAAEATAPAAGLPEAGAQTELEITVSVGAAAARSREGARDWLARADRALYEAKAAGRDRCVVAPA